MSLLYDVNTSLPKDPYLGFTYNGTHSSAFGIVRTSEGSRYNDNLLPTMRDKTIEIPGIAGKVLQRSEYDTRVFNVSIAYDALTEAQLQKMKKWLGDKKIHDLVFDETPYKTWKAKVTGTASMKWIPFDETATNRVYKGEGTIQFTCYEPFARCPFGFDYSSLEATQEWLKASRLEERNDKLEDPTKSQLEYSEDGWAYLKIYNCGDIDSNFVLKIDCLSKKFKKAPKLEIQLCEDFEGQASTSIKTLIFNELHANMATLRVNSKTNLVDRYIGKKKDLKTAQIGTTTGSFFKIPSGQVLWLRAKLTGTEIDEEGNETASAPAMFLEYDYLYL